MRSSALWVAIAAAAGCSSPTSYVVLSLQSADSMPINGVSKVMVGVSNGSGQMNQLTYPAPNPNIILDKVTLTNDLAISFSGSETGSVTLTVDVRDDQDCTIGIGNASVPISRGGRSNATVMLAHAHDCTHSDGGSDGGDGGFTFPGCDPVPPTSCGANMTCSINCMTSQFECTPSGAVPPGQACRNNNDCTPGSQCFHYTSGAAPSCNVNVCLQFCTENQQCAQPGDGGVGPGSLCAGAVICPSGIDTARHTCTFSCDPRAAAISAGRVGCPAGLACLVVGNMDQVDCACAEDTRTKTEGQSCTKSTECAPGLICNTTIQQCRTICRCDASGTSCNTNAGDCPGSETCRALSNDTIYGVCM
jgi:hypothetical protein